MRNSILFILAISLFTFLNCTNGNAEQTNTSKETTESPKVVLTNQETAETDEAEPETMETENEEERNSKDVPKVVAVKEEQTTTSKETANAPTITNEPKIVSIQQSQEKTPEIIQVVKEKPKAEPIIIEKKVETKSQAITHDDWNALLQKYVSASGKVNYKGFKTDKAKLDAYLKKLETNAPASSWSRNEKLAYYINAYNAFTVKLIVDNYPTSSITNLKGGKPWDVKWVKLGSKTYSLNNIENDIIRPQFKESRIHFAVNCAAKSCPPLLNKAWTASNLSRHFEAQAKAFVNNPKYNKVSANSVEISKIFEWYADDFGDIITYLNKYSNTKINAGAKVNYMEYDWNLNE